LVEGPGRKLSDQGGESAKKKGGALTEKPF